MPAPSPPLPVLFEDNHLLVVEKRAGLLSQADLSGDLDVLTLVKDWIRRRDGKPGQVYLGLVQRLDRPVAGVMVLAKTSKAASRLAAAIRERNCRKTYRAVVHGTPTSATGRLVHHLEKDPRTRITHVVEPPAGKRAELAFRVVATSAGRTLIEVDLVTGLPHQIRAQLAAIGCPVVGDRKYGSDVRLADGAIALFAQALELEHPVRHEPLRVETGPPPHWPWPEDAR